MPKKEWVDQPLQKKCRVECVDVDPGVAVGVGVASQLSGSVGGGFCLQQASTTDPVITNTTLRDFFTRVKTFERLADRGCYDMTNAEYNRSAQDAYGDIFVLAHLSFEIERSYQVKQFEASDRQYDPDCAENDGGYNRLKKSGRMPRRRRFLRCLSRRNRQQSCCQNPEEKKPGFHPAIVAFVGG